jgi:hypothetical protein
VVAAEPYTERPLRVAYRLTADGRDLAGALRLLADWGAREGGEAPAHQACGTPMEARWYCPTCGSVAEQDPGAEPSDVLVV